MKDIRLERNTFLPSINPILFHRLIKLWTFLVSWQIHFTHYFSSFKLLRILFMIRTLWYYHSKWNKILLHFIKPSILVRVSLIKVLTERNTPRGFYSRKNVNSIECFRSRSFWLCRAKSNGTSWILLKRQTLTSTTFLFYYSPYLYTRVNNNNSYCYFRRVSGRNRSVDFKPCVVNDNKNWFMDERNLSLSFSLIRIFLESTFFGQKILSLSLSLFRRITLVSWRDSSSPISSLTGHVLLHSERYIFGWKHIPDEKEYRLVVNNRNTWMPMVISHSSSSIFSTCAQVTGSKVSRHHRPIEQTTQGQFA